MGMYFSLLARKRSGEDVGGKSGSHALGGHFPHEVLAELLEGRDARRSVRQKDHLLDVFWIRETLDGVTEGVGQAVAESFTCPENHVRLFNRLHEGSVDLRRRVLGVRDFSLDRREVLRPGIGPLGQNIAHGESALLPEVHGFRNDRIDIVTLITNEAVLRPDDVRVTTRRFELLDVFEGAGLSAEHAGEPLTRLNVFWRDHGEGRRLIAVVVHPKKPVGYVKFMVGIHRQRNVVEFVSDALDHRRDAFHILLTALNEKGAVRIREVVLVVNEYEMGFECHGYPLHRTFVLHSKNLWCKDLLDGEHEGYS